MRRSSFLALSGAALLLAGPGAAAQLGEAWVSFTKQPGQLGVAPTALSDSSTQVGFRTGDLDQDGWDDVVAVRKQQASQQGKRAAFLLMNLDGVLTDQTVQYASASDVPGDLGFLTPCGNRECALGDVDGDGWLDVVTCTTLSDGDPKALSHPRVYVNRGDAAGGAWQGLAYEQARIPQLLTVGGLAVAPRFGGVGLGDVTGDGASDLYFVDFDGTETGILEPTSWDLNDRLLVNDGNGYFTDESAARLTPAQLLSHWGADAQVVDANADGAMDIVKLTTLLSPRVVRLIYNDPAHPGDFTAQGVQDVTSISPYGMDVGNLNNDGFLDLAIADSGTDRFSLGTGYDALQHVSWSALKTYTFLDGSDDGFGHNAYIRDLDADGWNDVLVANGDGDIVTCFGRLHVYHNTGTVPGDLNLALVEEVELSSGSQGAGWKGAVGLTVPDLNGCYDVGFGDWDRDGDLDLLIGTCSGTQSFRNETDPVVCQTDLGFGGPGSMSLGLCGDPLTEPGGLATLQLAGAAPNAPVYIPISLSIGPVPFKGGQLVPFPVLVVITGLVTDGAGGLNLPVAGSGGVPLHVDMQCLVKNGSVYEFSNALEVIIGA